ncbi:hypothetical protein KEM52_004130, partial [Ascosphaera acerosa]
MPPPGQPKQQQQQQQQQQEPTDEPPTAHITLTQRMLSASVGNFFTAVLVTPLDVVRVRLQSQVPGRGGASLLRASHPTLATSQLLLGDVPRGLGITSCCREVFW